MLKQLYLRKKLETAQNALKALREKDAEMQQREADLSKAIEEVTDDTPQEERDVLDEAVEAFENDQKEHDQSKKDLEDSIREIEAEIKEVEDREAEASKEKKKPEEQARKAGKETMVRVDNAKMSMRDRVSGMVERDDVKGFLENVRTMMREKRSITNVGDTIPEVMLPLIRQIAYGASKLMRKVNLKQLSGTGRQEIMGETPEAFWEDMDAALSELSLAFYMNEVDGFKASGYFAVANCHLEDSDIDLATELLNAIGEAIAKAVDKAILYGKNVKMPMGVVKSLLLTSAPSGYPAHGRTWTDLSSSNIITGTSSLTGINLFKEIVEKAGVIRNDYNDGEITWCMNAKTHTKLLAESMNINSNATIVAGMSNMPVIGGEIIEFKYIPDDTIIFGYFGAYLLAQRAGIKLGVSEHAKFIQDQTVFRGTARYDGKPMIREAFAVYGVGGAPDTTIPAFAGE